MSARVSTFQFPDLAHDLATVLIQFIEARTAAYEQIASMTKLYNQLDDASMSDPAG